MGIKVLVCGRERFTDRKFIFNELGRLEYENGPFDVVMQFGSGAGGGPDSCVRDWVWETGWEGEGPKLLTYRHDWDRLGPGAHLTTYATILETNPPDLIIVFGPEQGPHRILVRRACAQRIKIIEFPFSALAKLTSIAPL